MSKKPISQKRADREKQESQALHRVFNVFLLGLAAECYLLLVYRGYAMGTIDSLLIWHQILTWGMYLGLVMLIAGIAVGVAKRKDRRLRTIMTWVAGGGLFLALTGWVVTFFFDNSRGITAMCVLVPIAVVLALVYLLFQPECFLCTLTVSCAMFAVWARGASADSSAFGMVVIAGLRGGRSAAGCRRLSGQQGPEGRGQAVGRAGPYPGVRLSGGLRRAGCGAGVRGSGGRGGPCGLLSAVGAGHPAVCRAGVPHHQADVISFPMPSAASGKGSKGILRETGPAVLSLFAMPARPLTE